MADEAHHFNVQSSKSKNDIQTNEDSKPEDVQLNWENTIVDKVFNKNYLDTENNNILLEYTATVPDSREMEEKYLKFADYYSVEFIDLYTQIKEKINNLGLDLLNQESKCAHDDFVKMIFSSVNFELNEDDDEEDEIIDIGL